jgi:hypothetical protein
MYCALIDGIPVLVYVYYLPPNINICLVDGEIVLTQYWHLSSNNMNHPLPLIHDIIHIRYTSDSDIILQMELRNMKFHMRWVSHFCCTGNFMFFRSLHLSMLCSAHTLGNSFLFLYFLQKLSLMIVAQ